MNIMRMFGFDNDDDDYEDKEDYTDDRRKTTSRRSDSSRSGSGGASGKIIIYNYNGPVPNNDRKRLCDAFNDGAMILIDLHNVNQRQFEEEGKDFITFMGGVAFARSGEMKFIEPSQYLLTPRTNMCEIWPEGSDQE